MAGTTGRAKDEPACSTTVQRGAFDTHDNNDCPKRSQTPLAILSQVLGAFCSDWLYAPFRRGGHERTLGWPISDSAGDGD